MRRDTRLALPCILCMSQHSMLGQTWRLSQVSLYASPKCMLEKLMDLLRYSMRSACPGLSSCPKHKTVERPIRTGVGLT